MAITQSSVGSLFDKDSTRIEEILSKQIDTILPTLDPIWRDTVVSSQGVGAVSEFSKDFQVNKLYRTGMSGVIEQAYPVDDFPLYGEDPTTLGNRLLRSNAPTSTFPDPMDGAKPKTFRLTVPMRAMYTNLSLTLGELQMDATPAVIGDVVSPILQGFAQNLSHTLCNYWYLSQNDSYRLGTVATVSYTTLADGVYKCALTTTEKSYDRFFAGQRLDIINGADLTDRLNHVGSDQAQVYVEYVDDLKGEVGLISTSDVLKTSFIDAADILVYANSGAKRGDGATNGDFTGIAGINSWMKSTGNLLGGEAAAVASTSRIDVDEHPEFKSFFKGSVGVLTEHKLRQYLRRFHAAKNKLGQTIDSLTASDGVWLAYEAQKIGQYQIDRTGNLSNLNNEGSAEGFGMTFEGRTYKGHTSQYVEEGTVYGVKTSGGNWKRYVPPDYAGLQSMGEVPSHVPFRFVVPALTGGSSVKFPYLLGTGNKMTEAVQMPGMLRMQLIPEQAAGMKLTGVTTDTVYGD
tara:strand:- start:4329 stop:5876 length:1548 start_codon:yes stop_codon:yes gene_type:complete